MRIEYFNGQFSFEPNNSKVLSIELLDHLLEQFPLGNSVIHGKIIGCVFFTMGVC